MADFSFEEKLWKKGFVTVAGADEVGRGAWAGPVVAGAVVFAPATKIRNSKFEIRNTENCVKIDDSKKLTALQREKADKWIKENALCWGIGEAPVSLINRVGIGKATKIAFRRAIKMTNSKCQISNGKSVDFLLIDAFYLPFTKGIKRKNQLAIVHGDEKSFSIAAASIIAKVYRDNLMQKLAQKHPEFSWDKNKGYGTQKHQVAICERGLTQLHRCGFIPLGLLNNSGK